MAAGVGAGVYDSLVEASERLIVWEREYVPNRENFKIYEAIAQKWQEVYVAQLALVDRGLTESMWKAPGL